MSDPEAAKTRRVIVGETRREPCGKVWDGVVFPDCEAAINSHGAAFLDTWNRLQSALADAAVLREEVAVLKKRLRNRKRRAGE